MIETAVSARLRARNTPLALLKERFSDDDAPRSLRHDASWERLVTARKKTNDSKKKDMGTDRSPP